MTRRTASLAFLALAVFAGPLRAQSSPRAIVETLLTAMSAKVAARIRKLFADTATQQYGVGALKSGEAFRAWIESDVIAAEAVSMGRQSWRPATQSSSREPSATTVAMRTPQIFSFASSAGRSRAGRSVIE